MPLCWLCFDNLSHLSEELADAACRLATGGGFGARELYSDHDEAVSDATCPLVFNAVPDLGTARPDFLDRALIVDFLDIKPQMRRDEGRFWREFEQARPRILGVLLYAIVTTWHSACHARSATRWQISLFGSPHVRGLLGLGRGEALEAYRANCAEARNLALEASPVYEPLREVARTGFSGTSSELLSLLSKLASDSTRRSQRWPQGAQRSW